MALDSEYSAQARAAFRWIIRILKKHRIPYQVSGGLAAKAYGSQRPLIDIDIDVPENALPKLYALTKKYAVYGPKRWRGEGFKVNLLTLDYRGQPIDLGGSESVSIWSRHNKKWIPLSTDYQSFSVKKIMGERVKVITQKDLRGYKRILDRRVDRIDLQYL